MDGNKISVVIADDNKEFCSILNDYLYWYNEKRIKKSRVLHLL